MRMDFLKNEPWQEGPQASSAAVSGQLEEPGAQPGPTALSQE